MPATSAVIRSLSLTRSSAAPLTVTSPPCAASAAMAGSSSMRPGTSSGAMVIGRILSCSTTTVPRGSPPSSSEADTCTRAPNRRRTSSRPVRDGFRPTSSISTREPGIAAAATSQNAADEKSPGTCERPALQALAAGDRHGQAVHGRPAAEGGQRALGVVARRGRLGDAGRALGVQAGEQDGALDLRARHVRLVGDAVQPRAVDRQRRVAVGRLDAGAHALERLDDPPHRPARQRGVADQPARKADGPPGCRPAAASSCPSCRHRARSDGGQQAADTAALDENRRPADTSRGVLGHFDAESAQAGQGRLAVGAWRKVGQAPSGPSASAASSA